MGRTWRHRSRKKHFHKQFSLDCDPNIISLKKWLCDLGWKNESKLRLMHFPIGRGLTSSININPEDKLISLPFEALITFATLEKCEIWDVVVHQPKKLKSMDLFAMFLTIEEHKKEKSLWKEYVASLPETPVMPWLCSNEEFEYLPHDISDDLEEDRLCIESSIVRVENVLKDVGLLVCTCCQTPLHKVITRRVYISNYIFVLTRSVHIDINFILPNSNCNIIDYIIDTPSLVLCPFLDMFNHSSRHDAYTVFDTKHNIFSIITRCRFKRNEQIYFPYGKHHNLDLLKYYGFYMPNNELDFVEFELDFILKHWSLPKEKYNFIFKKELWKDLKVYLSGASFNLKAVLHIILENSPDWRTTIFTDRYSNLELLEINQNLVVLVNEKLQNFNNELIKMRTVLNPTKSFQLILDYYEYKLVFVQDVINMLRNSDSL